MRVVSGIQPTGNLHLGNYLGAIKQWVAMQDSMKPGEDCLFFLADLHALSQPVVAADLTSNTIEMAATLLACGIDPDRAILFNQARVPAHSELAWILGGTARMGWLNRMTQWKDKAGKSGESQSVALFTYPVLQAADVLLYQATHVPVGEDQKQHLELARDIATKFNNDYGVELFTLPEPFISRAAPRIMSLARRQREDVQVRPVGRIAHQPDRWRRPDRAEAEKGEDRSRAPARNLCRAGRAAGGEEPGHHLCGAGRHHDRRGDGRLSAARASARSSRRWPIWRWRRSGRSATG